VVQQAARADFARGRCPGAGGDSTRGNLHRADDRLVPTKAYKEQVRGAVVDAHEIPAGGVRLQIAFVVGPHRNWLSLWKPTIDALDPLLGRTRADRDWHPRDGRITDLGLHVDVDPSLGHDVLVTIAGDQATPA
jgi:hypothetical protein